MHILVVVNCKAMNIQIFENKVCRLKLYGFSAQLENNDFTATGFSLMNKMWKIVKANNLRNKGLNYWVYSKDGLFVGVELEDVDIYTPIKAGLQLMTMGYNFYAYYKHIGPYSAIKAVGEMALAELKKRKIKITSQYIEIYGHHNPDETKLETELIWGIQPSKEFMERLVDGKEVIESDDEPIVVPEGYAVADIVLNK